MDWMNLNPTATHTTTSMTGDKKRDATRLSGGIVLTFLLFSEENKAFIFLCQSQRIHTYFTNYHLVVLALQLTHIYEFSTR